MSGFAGMISLDGAPPDRRLLEKMAARLAFRGPDGTHITTHPGAGFCFTFLRTGPALQCTSQPCSLDGRVWLLGDVRLDGRDDLRLKLEQSGEELSADVTDEELVLRTWRIWGEEGIAELIGDYAFALWDAEARQLHCWRDLMGARPFFYAQDRGWFYFSNTLNAVHCVAGISRELDHHFIGDFLLQGWCGYPDRTAFRKISRLPAGHILSRSCEGVEVKRYTSIRIEEPVYLRREKDYVERFRELLKKAVLDRLPRGPTAVFMSGGLDSTSVAAFALQAARECGHPLDLRAYTLDYRPLFDDKEGYLASLAARSFGIPIEIENGASDLPYFNWNETFPPMPEVCHEPYLQLFFRLHQKIAQHARVALTGYGGDGVMTGQSWPYLIYLFGRFRFDTICKAFGGYALTRGKLPPLRGGFRSRLLKCVRHRSAGEYPSWIAPVFEHSAKLRRRWHELEQHLTSAHPWHPKAYALLNSGYWPTVLEGEDASMTGQIIEMRSPFLDLRVQHFLLQVPPVPLCIDKELLRRMMRGRLPEQIRCRPKTPFAGDQILLQMKKGLWSPLPMRKKPGGARNFLDWGKVTATLEKGPVSFPWSDLRPISLIYWLERVETRRTVK
jgi:asparagine synthase (glutamine-hydrolysing)